MCLSQIPTSVSRALNRESDIFSALSLTRKIIQSLMYPTMHPKHQGASMLTMFPYWKFLKPFNLNKLSDELLTNFVYKCFCCRSQMNNWFLVITSGKCYYSLSCQSQRCLWARVCRRGQIALSSECDPCVMWSNTISGLKICGWKEHFITPKFYTDTKMLEMLYFDLWFWQIHQTRKQLHRKPTKNRKPISQKISVWVLEYFLPYRHSGASYLVYSPRFETKQVIVVSASEKRFRNPLWYFSLHSTSFTH